MKKGIHNYSEIGKLNRVLLHRPGREVEALTPATMERLLFDDVPYLKEAQKEHDQFAKVLKDNGVDNINKLIETPGRGYRLQLFRHMMLEYHKTRPHKVKDFAAFTKLNNAKCVSIEPELTCGGVAAYAQKLLEEVSAPKEVE